MKLYKVLSLLMIAVILITGCAKDDNPTSSAGDELVGTWVMTKIILTSLGNTELTPAAVGYSATIIMKSDRTFTANYADSDGATSDAGTWSVANGKLSLKSSTGETQEMPYTLSGNKLTTETTLEVPTFGQIPVKLEFTKQ
jgi:uncharacterized cupin superfamily protein